MQHRGEIIREAVYKSGFTITEISKSLGKSRRWMYLMFENSNVSLDLVIKIGKVIHYDFSEEIKELNTTPVTNSIVKEENDVEFWKNKYLKLLEEYNELLKKSNVQ